MQSICQLCEATSQPELKKKIYEAYTAATAGRVATAPRQKPTMTAEQLQAVRAGIERLRQKAMDSGFRIAHCNDYLQLGFLYGCSNKHVPQRSDYVTFRYDGPDCDQVRDNYIAITDTECVLTINKATKVKLSAPNIIALHETSPKLAEFLVRFREHAQTVQQSNAPYLLMTTQLPIRPMTASNLTTRAPRLWQKLGLAFDAHGCIAARKAAVAASNRALGKRKLTASEIESEHVRAKQMQHSRAVAGAEGWWVGGRGRGRGQGCFQLHTSQCIPAPLTLHTAATHTRPAQLPLLLPLLLPCTHTTALLNPLQLARSLIALMPTARH